MMDNKQTTLGFFSTPEEDGANTPNAAKLIDSLRHVGYDNYHAVADILDNSIDAEATKIDIDVSQHQGDIHIVIADNGLGMDAATLDQALRLGSDTERDTSTDLGRFGMGLITASLSIGKTLEVYTKTENGDRLYARHDVDEIKARNSFVRTLRQAGVGEAAYFDAAVPNGQGTVVVISHTDYLSNRHVTSFTNVLRKHIARVHRYFLDPDIRRVYVRGELLAPEDPMGGSESEIFSDEAYPIRFTDTNGVEHEDEFRVRLAILPPLGKSMAKLEGQGIRNQGIYVMRNNREIKAATTLDLFQKHNDLNRFRGELFFTGELDEAMGVNFAKGELALSQPVADKLRQDIRPQIYTIKKRMVKSKTVADTSGISHEESERVISRKSKLLVQPMVERELRPGKPATDKPRKPSADTGGHRKNFKQSEKVESDRSRVRFETVSMGREGAIYSADLEGRVVVIQWNIDHPFYERFVLENKDDANLVTAADFLIYSMATAELRLAGTEELEWVATLKGTISTNLRVLLS
jgi:hypothetical protein